MRSERCIGETVSQPASFEVEFPSEAVVDSVCKHNIVRRKDVISV